MNKAPHTLILHWARQSHSWSCREWPCLFSSVSGMSSFSFLQVALKSRTLTLFPSSAGLLFLALEGEREPQRTDQFSSPLRFSSHSQGPIYLPRFPALPGWTAAVPMRVSLIPPAECQAFFLAGEKSFLFFASTVNPSTALAARAQAYVQVHKCNLSSGHLIVSLYA